ncbi:unnamed protein product [Gongylonema pulchrum]|uniref:Sema domain-containing protein n=1 Tax=Gongylonema pulchrum TaxID=637853 RepID=A0A183EMW4_9BILA|nr:unnamed protein product [Gongylonema pulchrum]
MHDRTHVTRKFMAVKADQTHYIVELELHDRTHATRKFMAVKADQTHYIVDSLKTPIGVIKRAALCMYDTLVISSDATYVLSHFKISSC